ncbi:MAG: PAS domain S-box protein [Bdellovibrionaceae bacterium]|nr:PAS domain S-box protein [Pseudobdellovibrionaceae bacterium]MBX3033423.1 PAS domain S-box protein [Pseudobdellovibrionaceae bacterium]
MKQWIFEEIFERSPVAMLLVKDNGEIALVNRHAEHMFLYERSELIGSKIETLVPENARGRHPALVKEYLNAPLSRQMGKGRNLFGVKKDRSLFPIEVGLNPIEIDEQVFVLSSVIDITERQRAEEKFKAAVEAAPNGMLMIDSTRKIVLINKKIEEIFGFTRDELVGNTIEMLVPEDFKGHHPKFVESFLRKPESRAMGIGRELFGRHKTGKLIPVEIGLQPITAGGETFVISSVVDITYRKHAETEIQRKTEELEEFSYRTSHDLRSPLKSIAGMAECILEDLEEKNEEAVRENVRRISSLSVKLMSLIEDILTLTKVEASQEKADPFRFEEYATLFREKYKALLLENRVQVEFNFLHQKDLTAQPTRLTQVLDNLISNGAKYFDEKKDNRSVKVRTFNNAHRFFIQIEDNGVGIPVERQEEVFGMFKRFHGPSVQGSGLGLYLVKKQIHKMDAQISFESGASGTVFYLEFPLIAPGLDGHGI